MQRMWGVKKVFSMFLFLALLISVLITACGGGGGGGGDTGSNTPPTGGNTNATITGTVAGTTVKAFDLSGNEVASNTATGNPKTFTLNVPANGSYKFYLIENEGTANERVYALYSDNTAATNVFNIASAVTIDLGFVDTSTGKAVPENNPLGSGATSGGEDTTIPSSLTGSAFSVADSVGTWNYHGLIAGDSATTGSEDPNAPRPGWYYGSYTFDLSGNLTGASVVTDSLGNSSYTPVDPTPSDPFVNVAASGTVTIPSVTSYHGVMNKGKNMMVATATMAPGADSGVKGYNLQIALKSGGTFTSSDLVGTWNFHSLTSGDSPAYLGWSYGTASIDINGIYTELSHTRSDGSTDLNSPFTLAVTTDGIITINGFSTFHGVMSQDKSMMVATMTDGGGGYGLIILQKAGGTFSQSDLTGAWNLRGLTSGDASASQWLGWFYGGMNIDNSGAAAWSFINRSDGNTTLPSSDSISITSGGIISSVGTPSFQGTMSQSKDLVVGTMTDGGGGYDLFVMMK